MPCRCTPLACPHDITSESAVPRDLFDGWKGLPPLKLVGMAVLAFAGAMLLMNAWRLLKRYARGHWDGWPDAGPWPLVWIGVNAVASGGLLLWLWVRIEDISARMGIAAVALLVLLACEVRPGRGRRRA